MSDHRTKKDAMCSCRCITLDLHNTTSPELRLLRTSMSTAMEQKLAVGEDGYKVSEAESTERLQTVLFEDDVPYGYGTKILWGQSWGPKKSEIHEKICLLIGDVRHATPTQKALENFLLYSKVLSERYTPVFCSERGFMDPKNYSYSEITTSITIAQQTDALVYGVKELYTSWHEMVGGQDTGHRDCTKLKNLADNLWNLAFVLLRHNHDTGHMMRKSV